MSSMYRLEKSACLACITKRLVLLMKCARNKSALVAATCTCRCSAAVRDSPSTILHTSSVIDKTATLYIENMSASKSLETCSTFAIAFSIAGYKLGMWTGFVIGSTFSMKIFPN